MDLLDSYDLFAFACVSPPGFLPIPRELLNYSFDAAMAKFNSLAVKKSTPSSCP